MGCFAGLSAVKTHPIRGRWIASHRWLDGVTLNRTRHTVSATPSLAQLKPGNRYHFDAGLAHLGDGEGIPLVRDHDPWLQRHGVVGVVPLLALHLILVAAGLDDSELLDLER